jgi:hypothetical protein
VVCLVAYDSKRMRVGDTEVMLACLLAQHLLLNLFDLTLRMPSSDLHDPPIPKPLRICATHATCLNTSSRMEQPMAVPGASCYSVCLPLFWKDEQRDDGRVQNIINSAAETYLPWASCRTNRERKR